MNLRVEIENAKKVVNSKKPSLGQHNTSFTNSQCYSTVVRMSLHRLTKIMYTRAALVSCVESTSFTQNVRKSVRSGQTNIEH